MLPFTGSYIKIVTWQELPAVLSHEFNRIQNKIDFGIIEKETQVESSKSRFENFQLVRGAIYSAFSLIIIMRIQNLN